ncbi:MAG TPA: PaaI family thioesterase [Ktedonobacterales bacterium]
MASETPERFDTQQLSTETTNPRERAMVVRWIDPAYGPRLAAQRGLTGIEFLRAILNGELPPPPIAKLMSLEMVSVEDGCVVFAATPGEQHYNPLGVVHGGLAATLLDTAIGCAMQTKAPAGGFYTTIELKVNYLRPLLAGMGQVYGEATVLNTSRNLAFAEARVVGANGKLYAHATSTCMLVQPGVKEEK